MTKLDSGHLRNFELGSSSLARYDAAVQTLHNYVRVGVLASRYYDKDILSAESTSRAKHVKCKKAINLSDAIEYRQTHSYI